MKLTLENQFQKLDTLLCQYRSYWQLQAFAYLELPWRDSNPELCRYLEQLSSEQIAELSQEPQKLLAELEVFFPELQELTALSAFPVLKEPVDTAEQKEIPSRFSQHIKGRKWQQIVAFEKATRGLNQGPTLEWCAGKGHLGRLLAHQQKLKLSSVEWQEALCEHGRDLAKQQHLNIDFIQADVLKDDLSELLQAQDSAVALHACGDLHLKLMSQSAEFGIQNLAIAPCCYHLISSPHYQPLSQAARSSKLTLSKADLKLALQETVVAGARVRRLRQIELAWRLGFDCLQRQVRGCNEYLAVPSVAKQFLSGRFADFCLWAAEKKHITLPAGVDFEVYLAQGQERVQLLEKIELIQHLFRAPIEAWLILDRALYLQEQGYELEIGLFCERSLSPRNILLKAQKH